MTVTFLQYILVPDTMALRAAVGFSIERDHIKAAREAIQQAIDRLGSPQADLIILFASSDFAHPLVLKTIAAVSGEADIIGATSLAVISPEGITKHGLALLALKFPEGVYYNVAAVSSVTAKGALAAGQELGEKLVYGFRDIRRDLSIIFSDRLAWHGQELIMGLEERLGKSFPLVGAASAEPRAGRKPCLYCKDNILSDAACGILWGGKLRFGIGTKHGWKPLGKPHRATKCLKNRLIEIDRRPAAQLYEDYLGWDRRRLQQELRFISVFYPLGMILPGEQEYLLRNIVALDDDGSLLLQGDMPEGIPVRLMIGTKESCLEATRQAVDEAKASLRATAKSFALIFNSASRYLLLRRQAGQELEVIKERLGNDTPFIGIYTYGEQAPLQALNYQGRTYLHNQTISVLTMGA